MKPAQLYTFHLCKKNCSVYIQCKGDIVVVDIKQHKSQTLPLHSQQNSSDIV